jgi:glutamate synthase (NADPH/NADH) small chain
MSKLPEDRSEQAFDDFKSAYTRDQAVLEADRCLFCSDAPCVAACPTHIDIPQFIRKIATDNVKGSARTIFDANVFGMSCARVCPVEVLCVGDCVYNALGVPPIQIGKLQRYATDVAYDQGWRFFAPGPASGHSVGVVGGGPASLAAAHQLRRLGHAVTVYEKGAVLGGLNTTGVAPYKMRADAAVLEADWVLAIGGIEVQTGVTVGVDVGWTELEARHDALFIGLGLGPDRHLGVPGGSLGGVVGAVAWIEAMKLGTVDLSAVRRALVVGGGNTAVDCVRELLGLGVGEVTLVYRGDEEGMSGYAHEWAAAKVEGARAAWRSVPVAYEGVADALGGAPRVTDARCVRLGEDRRPLAGTEHALPADLVLLAIGQTRLGDMLADLPGFTLDGGRIVVDANGYTGRAGVFAGGDCANGGKEVVNAVAEGKAAAVAIDRYLRRGDTAYG